MPVLVINITGNERNFENQFCNELASMIATQVQLINIRGEGLIDSQIIDRTDHEVILVVSHAGKKGNLNTELDCGFEWELLDNPTIFTQILPHNNKRFILIYCACEALSPETIASGIADRNCIGVIASRNPVKYTHINILADVINLVHGFVVRNDIDITSLQRNIRRLVEQNKDYPDFWLFDVPRVSEEN